MDKCRYSIRSKCVGVGLGDTDREGGLVEICAGNKQSRIGRVYQRDSPCMIGVYLNS